MSTHEFCTEDDCPCWLNGQRDALRELADTFGALREAAASLVALLDGVTLDPTQEVERAGS